MAKSNSMFHVVTAADLQPERDVLVALPQEATNSKQAFFRVPIRSSSTADPDRRVRLQLVDGCENVVRTAQGLMRLLVRFPSAFVPGIKVFEANNENDRTNLSLGFALYDNRVGPTADEQRVLANVDALALFLRNILIRSDRIRKTLKLGPDAMSVEQQKAAVELMDLHVARPATERPVDTRGKWSDSSANGGNIAQMPSRYCYVKLVAPDPHVPDVYHTYFWTPDGRRLPFDTVVGFRNFHVEAFVEIEDIFVSRSVRAIQLKGREFVVYPPPERMSSRHSVCFPERVCRKEDEEEDLVLPAPAVTDLKRKRVVEAEDDAETDGGVAAAAVEGEPLPAVVDEEPY